MSVSLFRVGRDASGIAQRHATGVLTAGGGQANLNLIATGFGEADATFVINVPGPPPRLQYDREYVETDDPYNTFVSETDYDYSAGDIGTFGKLSYGITQPTRIYQ